jgi:hypothetical protein
MAINPFRVGELQLPQPLRPVPIDFSPLQSIGEGIGQYRQQQQIGEILAGATGPDGQLDLNKAATNLGAAGHARLAEQMVQRAIQQQTLRSAEADRQRTYDLAKQQYETSVDPEVQGRLAAARRGPTAVAPGTTLVGPDNQPVYTAPVKPELKTVTPGASVINEKGESVFTAPPPASIYDAETLGALAAQARAGDTSVFTNVGRGAQGAENIAALRREIARQNKEAGTTPEEQAAKNAEYFGTKAGQRTLGTRTANIEQAVTEAQQLAPLVLEASSKVDRTSFPLLNSVILAAERGTGDENVTRLGVAINGMINVYARAINPTGVPTVSDKEHARDILQAAWSKGQIGAAIDQMNKEMAAARAAPGLVKEQMREGMTGKKTETPTAPQSQTTGPKPVLDKVKNSAEANALAAEAADFVAKNPSARDAVYKRLIERDVPPAAARAAVGMQ